MKLSVWCKKTGISYATGLRWFHLGKIPNAYQFDTKTIIVDDESLSKNDTDLKRTYIKNVAIYARVSKKERKDDLERQVSGLIDFSNRNGYSVNSIYKEIASGMNDNRKVFWKMIDNNHDIIVVENRDRLTRFGFNYIQRLLSKLNIEIIVVNKVDNDKNEIIQDFISIITSFCCRIYGIRGGKNKSNTIKNDLIKND